MAKHVPGLYHWADEIDSRYELRKCPKCSKISYKCPEPTCRGCGKKLTDTEWLPILAEEIEKYNERIRQIVEAADEKFETILASTKRYIRWGAASVAAVGLFVPGGYTVGGVKIAWDITIVAGALLGYVIARVNVREIADSMASRLLEQTRWALFEERILANSRPAAATGPLPAIIHRMDEHLRDGRQAYEEIKQKLKQRTRWFVGVSTLLLAVVIGSQVRYWYIEQEYRREIGRVRREHDAALRELQERLRNPNPTEVLVTGVNSINEFAHKLGQIDTSHCPPEFRLEFVELIHKWQVFSITMKDHTGLVAAIRNVLDFTRVLDFASQGTISFSDVQMQYIRLHAIATEHGTEFTQVHGS